MDLLQEMAARRRRARTADQPARTHRLYLELASFTSAYLEHQDVEERVVMPALEAAIGVESTIAIHGAIVGSIPPDEMAQSLALMLPAMNIDERTALLGGIRGERTGRGVRGRVGPRGLGALAGRSRRRRRAPRPRLSADERI